MNKSHKTLYFTAFVQKSLLNGLPPNLPRGVVLRT